MILFSAALVIDWWRLFLTFLILTMRQHSSTRNFTMPVVMTSKVIIYSHIFQTTKNNSGFVIFTF